MERASEQTTTAVQRRSAVRHALYDTVARLSAVSDSTTLIEILCRDVRRALNCEVTYIATTDAEGEHLTATTARGEPAVRFSSVKTARSVGIAGLVVSTGRVFATSNYWEDEGFNRDPEIDAILRREALVAYAGAPIVADGKSIGALLVAERHEREFTQFDLELLSEIAAIAGPALKRTQLSEAKEVELAALNRSCGQADAFRGAVTRILQSVVDGTEPAQTRELAISEVQQRFGVTALLSQAADSAADEYGWTSVHEVPNAGRLARFLCIASPAEPETGWLEATAESAAQLLGIVSLMEESRVAADERTRGELLHDLLAGRSPQQLKDRARKLGVEGVINEAAALVILPSNPSRRGLRSMRVMSLVKEYGGLVEDQGERVVFLLPNIALSERSDALARAFFGETGSGFAGLSAVGETRSFSFLIDEALSLAAASKTMGAKGVVAHAANLGFVGAALSSDDQRAALIVDKELGPVMAYDNERATELVATMHAYVRNNFNARLTAEELVIHPKTVAQRLARISALLGEDWAVYPRNMKVASALELYSVQQHLGAGGNP